MWPTLQNVVNKLSPSKGRKRVKRNLADELSDEEEDKKEALEEGERTNFNQADKDFLMQLTTVMATTTDAKIHEAIDPLKKEMAELKKQLSTSMLPEVDKEALKRELREEILNEMKLSPPPGLGSQASDMTSTAPSQSQSDSLTYVMGGLGFDDRPELIKQMCLEVLQRFQLNESDFFDIYVPFEFSSSANLVFCDTRKAQLLAMQLRGTKVTFSKHSETGRPVHVWCSLNKWAVERRPANYVRMMGKVVSEKLVAEGIVNGSWIVCGASKSIFYQSKQNKLGKLERDGRWKWEEFATKTFAAQDLDACVSAVDAKMR